MWPATLTVLPNRLNCICKQIETHWNYSSNIWLWKGLDKRTSRRKLKQTFSPDHGTRLGKHYSRQKSSDTADKKKPWRHSKQVAGTSKRVCLLDGKAVAPTTSMPEAQKAKQANKKNFRNMMAARLKWRLTLCSMLLEGCNTNRFSNISSFEFQHQTWK